MGHYEWCVLCEGLCKPLTGLSVAPDDGETERYGKAVSDLQEEVAIADGAVSGTLKYVTGYTGFSSDADEQEGNYLALKLTAEPHDKIEVAIGDQGPVDVTADEFVVIRLTELTDPLEITVKNGVDSATEELDLTGLTLEDEDD